MRPEIEQALALMKDGDEAALNEALTLLQNTVFSFSMRVCGQREDAEDTMQEVLARSIPYLSRFDNPKALAVWLYKVAKNRCLMNRRKSKFAPAHELSLDALMPDRAEMRDFSDNGRIDPEVLAMKSEQARHLRLAIHKLPPRYRIVLVLRDIEGLSDNEVAEITGLRPGTVRVRLHRARLYVRKELMRVWRAYARTDQTVSLLAQAAPPRRPGECKAMFAELSDYLDERLDDSMCEKLEQHMEGCEPCQAFIATLEAAVKQCRSAPAESPRPDRATKVRREVLSELQQARAHVSGGK